MRTTDWLLLFALSVLWGATYFLGCRRLFQVIALNAVKNVLV